MISDLLPFVVAGVVAGSIYGLAAVGIVLTYRTSGVFNFGFGAIAAGAAFLFYALHDEHGVPWPFSVLMTLFVFALVVGPVLEFVTRPITAAPDALVIVVTVGILLGVEGYLYLQFGDTTRTFPSFLPTSGFRLSGVLISWGQLISILVAAAGAVGVATFLKTARSGVAMRAVVDNPTLVALGGERPERIRVLGWALGSAAAAVCGILLAPVLNLDVNLLTFLVVQALGACAVGYFSSLPLTYAGGLVVGIAAAVATKYVTSPPLNGIPTAMPFIILIAALLVVPRARLPASRMALSTLIAPVTSGLRTRDVRLVYGAGAVGLAVIPLVAGIHLPVWTAGLAYFVLFASLSLLTWGSGQLSLCQASFVALGATSLDHLTHAGLPWLPALVLAGLLTMPAGALIAIPAIRLSGIYLALATLGFGILMQDVAYGSFLMFGRQATATASAPKLPLLGHDTSLYVATVLVALVCGALVVVIYRTQFGRFLRGLAEAPLMLSAQGLSVNIARLAIVCISAFLAGIAGALFLTQAGTVSGITFGPMQSLLYVAVLGICGRRLLASPAVAALLVGVLPGYLSIGADQQVFAFGAIAVVAGLLRARQSTLVGWLEQFANSAPDRRRRTLLPPLPASTSLPPEKATLP